ncbi:uncharacterized protein [Watersipora subatra]|uniref:uncharacterized protein n=1 Tax=Watersipora subatra TaxID=2589382 RepID=UPI00355BF5D5
MGVLYGDRDTPYLCVSPYFEHCIRLPRGNEPTTPKPIAIVTPSFRSSHLAAISIGRGSKFLLPPANPPLIRAGIVQGREIQLILGIVRGRPEAWSQAGRGRPILNPQHDMRKPGIRPGGDRPIRPDT